MADDVEAASAEEAPGGAGGATGGKGGVAIGKKQVKNEHVLIIIGVVTLIITYVFLKRSAAGNTASNSSTAADNPTYDSDISQMNQDMQAMQSEIAGLSSGYGGGYGSPYYPQTVATAPASTPAPNADTQPVGITQNPLSSEVQQGAGYWGGSAATSSPIQNTTGQTFQYLPSWAQAQQDIAEDVPVFYQSAPGVFQSATTPQGQLAPALTQPGVAPTPLYVGNA